MLEACCTHTSAACDSRLLKVATPLHVAQWQQRLRYHPDAEFGGYILRGIEFGFHIGVREGWHLQSAQKNMQSAREHPQVIEEYLCNKVAQECILGPYSPSMLPSVHINRFGVIPKKHQPNKWRLITDLSFPEGHSINDAIDPALCSLSYISVDQAAMAAFRLGKGSLLAKADKVRVQVDPSPPPGPQVVGYAVGEPPIYRLHATVRPTLCS